MKCNKRVWVYFIICFFTFTFSYAQKSSELRRDNSNNSEGLRESSKVGWLHIGSSKNCALFDEAGNIIRFVPEDKCNVEKKEEEKDCHSSLSNEQELRIVLGLSKLMDEVHQGKLKESEFEIQFEEFLTKNIGQAHDQQTTIAIERLKKTLSISSRMQVMQQIFMKSVIKQPLTENDKQGIEAMGFDSKVVIENIETLARDYRDRDQQRSYALVIGENVYLPQSKTKNSNSNVQVMPINDYSNKLKQYVKEYEATAKEFLIASKKSASVINGLRGALFEKKDKNGEGRTLQDKQRFQLSKKLKNQMNAIRALGPSNQRELLQVHSIIIDEDLENLQNSISNLNKITAGIIAAPFAVGAIGLAATMAPLSPAIVILAAKMGVSSATLGASSAAIMASMPIGFGVGNAALSSGIDTLKKGESFLCNFIEQAIPSAAEGMVWGAAMAFLPSAAIGAGIGTAALGGSASLGESVVNGGSSIYFVQSQVREGTATALNCYDDFVRARSETSEAIETAIKTEAYKKCVGAMQSLTFAALGGHSLTKSTLRSIKAKQVEPVFKIEKSERGQSVKWHNLSEHVTPVAENTKVILKDLPISKEGKVLTEKAAWFHDTGYATGDKPKGLSKYLSEGHEGRSAAVVETKWPGMKGKLIGYMVKRTELILGEQARQFYQLEQNVFKELKTAKSLRDLSSQSVSFLNTHFGGEGGWTSLSFSDVSRSVSEAMIGGRILSYTDLSFARNKIKQHSQTLPNLWREFNLENNPAGTTLIEQIGNSGKFAKFIESQRLPYIVDGIVLSNNQIPKSLMEAHGKAVNQYLQINESLKAIKEGNAKPGTFSSLLKTLKSMLRKEDHPLVEKELHLLF